MIEQLINFLQKIKSNPNLMSLGETAARSGIIEPILRILGWDTSIAVEEVIPEYAVEGGRVDYCLRASRSTLVFIEAKKPSEDLEKHYEQLLEYSFRQGVKLAVLSNGITWSFYLPLREGKWQDRHFYTIDVFEQDTSIAAIHFLNILSKDSIASGETIKIAEKYLEDRRREEIIEQTIPEAWNKIISDSDPTISNLIAELTGKICGFQPSKEDITNFFQLHGNRFLLLPEDESLEEKNQSTVNTQRKQKAVSPENIKKITQDELIPYIVKILQENGGGASKDEVETKIYQMFKAVFEQSWYQELVSYGVPRWQHNVAWARERAKRRGLIKPPSPRGRGYWELTDKGKEY